jgi:hypothetical protein
VQLVGDDFLHKFKDYIPVLLAQLILANADNPMQDMLVEPLPHGHFDEIGSILHPKELYPCLPSPYLFEKDAFFKFEEKCLQFFWEVCIVTEPIQWGETCHEGNTEVLAVFLKGKILGFVGIVEYDTSETQDCIQMLWLSNAG